MKENAQTSKRYQRGFEPGLFRLRVRHSTTEPPRSYRQSVSGHKTIEKPRLNTVPDEATPTVEEVAWYNDELLHTMTPGGPVFVEVEVRQ